MYSCTYSCAYLPPGLRPSLSYWAQYALLTGDSTLQWQNGCYLKDVEGSKSPAGVRDLVPFLLPAWKPHISLSVWRAGLSAAGIVHTDTIAYTCENRRRQHEMERSGLWATPSSHQGVSAVKVHKSCGHQVSFLCKVEEDWNRSVIVVYFSDKLLWFQKKSHP